MTRRYVPSEQEIQWIAHELRQQARRPTVDNESFLRTVRLLLVGPRGASTADERPPSSVTTVDESLKEPANDL